MAQGAPMARTIIDDFENVVNQLIQEAARFAAEGPGPGSTQDEAEGNIRRLRVLSGALNSALQSLQFMPPRPPTPTPIEPEPQEMTGAVAAAQPRPTTAPTPPPRR